MATSFDLTLDTQAPGSPSISVDGGASFSGDSTVDLTLSATGGDVTKMKVYGDVDDAADTARYRTLEANAPWVDYATAMNGVVLSSGDGSKTVKVKFRDDVLNVSSEATDGITVDSDIPVPNITVAPDLTKISKIATKDTSTFTFEVDQDVQAWKVKFVPNSGSAESAGTQIPTTAGSTGVSGGSLSADTPQVVELKGTDIETAFASSNAVGTIKLFAQDENTGVWSV